MFPSQLNPQAPRTWLDFHFSKFIQTQNESILSLQSIYLEAEKKIQTKIQMKNNLIAIETRQLDKDIFSLKSILSEAREEMTKIEGENQRMKNMAISMAQKNELDLEERIERAKEKIRQLERSFVTDNQQ